MNALSCHACLVARANGQTRCIYCGAALPQGRDATDRERFETSREHAELRGQQIAEARRTSAEVDRLVQTAIEAHIAPTGEFTHDHLLQYTGLHSCAVKYALERLAAKGIVRVTGVVFVRSNRPRPKWQFLLPTLTLGAPAAAPASSRRLTAARV